MSVIIKIKIKSKGNKKNLDQRTKLKKTLIE